MLTIPGCSASAPVKFDATPVVSLASVRCPSIDPKLRTEFRRTTPVPPGHVRKSDTREWVDAFETSELRKNAYGQVLIQELERCRGETSADATS